MKTLLRGVIRIFVAALLIWGAVGCAKSSSGGTTVGVGFADNTSTSKAAIYAP